MVSLKHAPSTIDDLMALSDDMKAELVDGVIYAMAPALARHSLVGTEIASELSAYFKAMRKKGSSGGSGDALVIISEAWTYYDEHNSFVHDIAGYLESDLPELPKLGPILATPKWVCEILSPSNWANDTRRKKVILEEHRVPYYWLVDPERKTIQVFELPENATKYQFTHSVEKGDGEVRLPPFLDLELDLMEIFRRV